MRPSPLRLLIALTVLAAVAALAFSGVGGGVAAQLAANEDATAATTSTTPATGTGTGASPPASQAPLTPTRLLAPARATIANGTQSLDVRLSGPVASGSPSPSLVPSVAGSWKAQGDYEVFTPVSTLEPCSSYSLIVWARTQASGQSQLGRRHTIALTVPCPPLTGAQQALARLGYLGATLRPRYRVHYNYVTGPETRRAAAEHAFHPPRGALAPVPSNAPPVHMGELDAVTRGALEVFQADNGLEANGEASKATWLKLLYDVTVNKRDPRPYTWVQVSESLPETLWLHLGHHVAFSTPVNTGVAGAETEQGIFPIYSRFVSTSMSGTDPDGVHYEVPDVPWVNYFNGGDAVHGYPREAYGFPQSNGCVELPIEAAHTVFEQLAIGDIVWVQ
jgi:hypothetical protein